MTLVILTNKKLNIIMKKILFIGLVAFLMLSCEKSNIGTYQNYIGYWSSTSGDLTRSLEVQSNGKSFYKEVTRSGNVMKELSFNGVFVMEGTTLKVGFKKLIINKEPAQLDGSWYVTMNNNEYPNRGQRAS